MSRTTILSAVIAIVLPLGLGAGTTVASADRDTTGKLRKEPVARSLAQPSIDIPRRLTEATRLKQNPTIAKDVILYNIISDQIGEMRRKSALPAVMCIAQSTGDGHAETISRPLMARLEADNSEIEGSLFTLKDATACESAGKRWIDRETHGRAMMIVAGPLESEMKELMTECGDYVGGFVRATDDSDFDFYTINGGDVARKLGCELAQ